MTALEYKGSPELSYITVSRVGTLEYRGDNQNVGHNVTACNGNDGVWLRSLGNTGKTERD